MKKLTMNITWQTTNKDIWMIMIYLRQRCSQWKIILISCTSTCIVITDLKLRFHKLILIKLICIYCRYQTIILCNNTILHKHKKYPEMLNKVCTWIYIQFMYSIFAKLLEISINSPPQPLPSLHFACMAVCSDSGTRKLRHRKLRMLWNISPLPHPPNLLYATPPPSFFS